MGIVYYVARERPARSKSRTKLFATLRNSYCNVAGAGVNLVLSGGESGKSIMSKEAAIAEEPDGRNDFPIFAPPSRFFDPQESRNTLMNGIQCNPGNTIRILGACSLIQNESGTIAPGRTP